MHSATHGFSYETMRRSAEAAYTRHHHHHHSLSAAAAASAGDAGNATSDSLVLQHTLASSVDHQVQYSYELNVILSRLEPLCT